jgi:hypothetical protein
MRLVAAPEPLHRERIDNIAILPASALFRDGQWRAHLDQLPARGVLVCLPPWESPSRYVFERIAQLIRERRYVKVIELWAAVK